LVVVVWGWQDTGLIEKRIRIEVGLFIFEANGRNTQKTSCIKYIKIISIQCDTEL